MCVCVCVRRGSSLSRSFDSLELQKSARRDEQLMSRMDGKRKEQAERLGMGFGARRSVLRSNHIRLDKLLRASQ